MEAHEGMGGGEALCHCTGEGEWLGKAGHGGSMAMGVLVSGGQGDMVVRGGKKVR